MTPPSMPRLKPRQAAKAKPVCLFVEAQCSLTSDGVFVQLPIRVENENNKHEHWRLQHRRTVSQKSIVRAVLGSAKPVATPCVVTFTVVRPRWFDSDGCVASLKWIRDAIADWLGHKDGPNDPIEWVYQPQTRSGARRYGVLVTVRSASRGEP